MFRFCLVLVASWLFLPVANAAPAVASAGAAASGDALVKQGEYLARAADCMACHTGDPSKPYAGARAIQSVYGTIYSSNITSDKDSGIGSYTRADFDRVMRQGVRKDGAYLYPAMPYDNYTKISDKDMDALWAFVSRIPPIKNTIPKNTLPFPLSVRTGMAVWQAMYLKQGRFMPTPGKDATWNRGAYLVEAFAHCSACHTPRNAIQGPEASHRLGGAMLQGWYAPDISNDANSKLAYWNVQQLAKFMKSGVTPSNGNAFGPMQEVVHSSLQYLKLSDLNAMAVYLKDQADTVTPRKATKATLPDLAMGKTLYEDNCSSCHQSNGKGIANSVPALAGNTSVTAAEPYNVIMAMLEGFQPQGTWGAMASFANALNDDQIAAIANYTRTAWGNDAQPNAAPWTVGNWRKNAQAPAASAPAMLCPELSGDVMAPAVKVPPEQLRQAAGDDAKLASLVGSYTAARPNSSRGDVIQALSTAYCRVVTNDKVSPSRVSADIANFAQRVAQVPIRTASK